MSRVAKMPVLVPQGVDLSLSADLISVKGSLGSLVLKPNALVKIEQNDGKLTFAPADDSAAANAMSGTMRQLVNNMVVGVSKGFEKKLDVGRMRMHPYLQRPWKSKNRKRLMGTLGLSLMFGGGLSYFTI